MNIQSSSNVNVSMGVIQKTVRESAKDDQQDGMKTKSSKFSKAINKKKEVAELSRKKADKDVEAQEESAEGSMWSGIWAAVGAGGGIVAALATGPIGLAIGLAIVGAGATGGLWSNYEGQSDSADKKAEAAEFQELAANADVEALSAQDKADKAKSSVSNSRDRMKQALEINRTILSYQNNAVNEITRAVGSGGRA